MRKKGVRRLATDIREFSEDELTDLGERTMWPVRWQQVFLLGNAVNQNTEETSWREVLQRDSNELPQTEPFEESSAYRKQLNESEFNKLWETSQRKCLK